MSMRHYRECYNEEECAGKTCGYARHCQYDDYFGYGALPEKYEAEATGACGASLGIMAAALLAKIESAGQAGEEKNAPV